MRRSIINCFIAKRTFSSNKGFKFQKQNLIEEIALNYRVSEVTIPVPGGIIAGKLWEPSKSGNSEQIPPVICLHGWLDNCGTYDTLLPLLLTQNSSTTVLSTPSFLAIDLPGHGLTTYCAQWLFDGYVDGIISIQRVLRHFNWEKVSIIGHSFGSIVGFLFNGLYPDTVQKYIAMEVMRPIPRPTLDMLESAINLVFEVEERDKLPRKAYEYEDMVKKFYEARQEQVSMEGCKILLKRGARPLDSTNIIQNGIGSPNPTDLYEYSYNFRTLIPGQEGRISKEISEELADRVSSPICYIKADPGNNYETKEEYHEFFKIFKRNLGNENFEEHLVPGSHQFHLNTPELVAPIISRFLRN